MNTPIQQVRSLVQDQPVLVHEALTLDGQQLSARLTYYPVIGSSVVATTLPAPATVDEQSGLITWATPPLSGPYTLSYKFVQLLDSTIQDLFDIQAADDDSENDDADDVRLVAANALDSIATQLAVIQRKIRLLDMQTDGPAVATSLRAHAEILRKQVVDPLYNERTFDIVEEINDTSGYREKVLKDFLRETP